ncbi:MAG: transglycosylase SLT domain-containing protein, partial [Chloroflexi bacterium]|nr:transglycosylase SLT domain-containing protein [Chloroflexota bacterium]
MVKRLLIILSVLAIITTGCGLFSLPNETDTSDNNENTEGGIKSIPLIETLLPPTQTPSPEPAIRAHQADWLLFSGDYDQAYTEYQNTLNNTSDREIQAAALVGMARVNYLKGNYTAALQAALTVTSNFTDTAAYAGAAFVLGQSYTALENYSEAANAYQLYLVAHPGVIDAYANEMRGDALMAARQYTEALGAYMAAIQAPKLENAERLSVKVGQTYSAMGDYDSAIRTFMALYETTGDDYMKAQANLLAGQAYLAISEPEQAYARFQDSVNNYPKAYDSYSGLVALIDAGQSVDELNRGIVDYFAGQYGMALEAINRYIADHPDHDGTPLHYKGLIYQAMGEPENAIAAWDQLTIQYADNRFLADAYDEKAYTQWVYLDQYSQGAQTMLEFVRQYPNAPEAANFLFEAGRIQERNDQLADAAGTWARLIDEYPSAEISYRALFLAGITQYRLASYDQALNLFQRVLALAVTPSDKASGYFWIAKTQQSAGRAEEAQSAFQLASQSDPTGYYSNRAEEILSGSAPLATSVDYNLDYDLEEEKHLAELWMRSTFAIPDDTNLDDMSALEADPRFQRANEFYALGLYANAVDEFESLRNTVIEDPINNFRLLGHLVDLGFYRQAVLVSRQILTLANMDDLATLTAPAYFNHIRFGIYFKDLILSTAQKETFHPLFVFALIRQESLFEGFAQSSAGARGLMQIMPATGQEIASEMQWPPSYSSQDLYRAVVNVPLGIHYLARQLDYFNSDIYAALAAYNGGPGNAY